MIGSGTPSLSDTLTFFLAQPLGSRSPGRSPSLVPLPSVPTLGRDPACHAHVLVRRGVGGTRGVRHVGNSLQRNLKLKEAAPHRAGTRFNCFALFASGSEVQGAAFGMEMTKPCPQLQPPTAAWRETILAPATQLPESHAYLPSPWLRNPSGFQDPEGAQIHDSDPAFRDHIPRKKKSLTEVLTGEWQRMGQSSAGKDNSSAVRTPADSDPEALAGKRGESAK